MRTYIGDIAMIHPDGGGIISGPVRWTAVAVSTVKSEGSRRTVATNTRRPNPTYPVQIDSVTEGAGILDITSRVVERAIRTGPTILRMGVVLSVAGFTALVAGGDDAEIEARVAAGATRLAMAGLADRQVGLGIRTMIGAKEIAAIEWVWCLSRAVRMAALTIEAGRKATWCCLVALQGRTVAGRARISTICCRIAAVISIGIIPFWRVSCKRWFGIVRVTAVTADGITVTGQIQAMAGFALVIAGIGCRFHGMSGKPARRVCIGVGRGIRTAAGTGTYE